MPVKNGMPYLPLTLESIAAQTYRNQSLLVWDDCSTDGSLEELHRWIPERIPGRIFEGKPLRIGPCLAFLVEQAGTEFCARIDGDDIAHPERLEQQVAYLQSHPQVAVLGSYIQMIDSEGRETSVWRMPYKDADVRWTLRYSTVIPHPAVLFRRSAVLAAGNYPTYKYEDSALWIRMSVMNYELENFPEPLLQYRRTDTSSTGTVVDWLPITRTFAEFSAPIMFPGIADPKQAMELWDASNQQSDKVQPRLRHLRAYAQAAVAHARHVGKPDNYFLNCDAYREKRYHLRRRVLEGFGLGPLLRLRDRLASQ